MIFSLKNKKKTFKVIMIFSNEKIFDCFLNYFIYFKLYMKTLKENKWRGKYTF
jgi:hypothetical protein